MARGREASSRLSETDFATEASTGDAVGLTVFAFLLRCCAGTTGTVLDRSPGDGVPARLRRRRAEAPPLRSGWFPSRSGSSGVKMSRSPSAVNSKAVASRGRIVTACVGQVPSSVPLARSVISVSQMLSLTSSAPESSGLSIDPDTTVTALVSDAC